MIQLCTGDVIAELKKLPEKQVQTVITSPPYWAQRSYNVDGQIGLEDSPDAYVQKMVSVFQEVRRVLRDDGTVWLNLGDKFSTSAGSYGRTDGGNTRFQYPGKKLKIPKKDYYPAGRVSVSTGVKTKNLIGIPWKTAFALQDDGWFLRSCIVWNKTSCLSGGTSLYVRSQRGDMPMSVKDLVRLKPETTKLWTGNKWVTPIRWIEYTDSEGKYEIVLRSGERIGCTSAHIWPTTRGNVKSSELKTGDVIKICTLPEPDKCADPNYLTKDALWFIGMYLAEGSHAGSELQFSLHADELPWLGKFKKIASYYGGRCGHTLVDNSLTIRVSGRLLHAIIETYIGGRDSLTKHLKNSVWELSNDSLRVIISAYLAGNGCKDGNRWRLGFCRNSQLARDIRVAAARLNASLTLLPRTTQYQNGKRPIYRGEWRWNRSGYQTAKPRSEIVKIERGRARKYWDIVIKDKPHTFALASGVMTHNCMPEPVKDRPSVVHEYIFLLSKSAVYYYDKTPHENSTNEFKSLLVKQDNYQRSVWTTSTNSAGLELCAGCSRTYHSSEYRRLAWGKTKKAKICATCGGDEWEAHAAPYPESLIIPCVQAGSRRGDVVMDIFSGSGTTGVVALKLGRSYIGIDLNKFSIEISRQRLARVAKLRGKTL